MRELVAARRRRSNTRAGTAVAECPLRREEDNYHELGAHTEHILFAQEKKRLRRMSLAGHFPELGIQIRMFLGLPDQHPLVRGMDLDPPDPSLFS